MNRQIKSGIQGLAWGAVAAVLFVASCVEKPLDPSQSPSQLSGFKGSMDGGGFTAVYDPAQDRILLSWKALEDGVVGYRIYRTTGTNPEGDPDTAQFTRVEVPAGATSYSDIPSPSISRYFYGIRSVRVDGGDTVEGELTPWPGLRLCRVGEPVRLSINRGDLFVAMPACSVFIEDTTAALASVRFTDIARTDSIDSAGVWHEVKSGTALQTDPNDVYRQVAALIRGGVVKAVHDSVILLQKARRRAVPLFDSSDGRNRPDVKVLTASGVYGYPWQLTMGSGQKTVYAEVIYKTGRKDTLLDLIDTKPHRVEMIVRNAPQFTDGRWSDSYPKDTLRSRQGPRGYIYGKIKIFYFPRIRFSVKTFGDTTINDAFDYWIMTGRENEDINPPTLFNDTSFRWYTSEPEPARISIAAGDQEYEYTFDPLVEEGRAHLRRIRGVRKMRIDTTVISASVQQNFTTLTRLRNAAMDLSAAKTTEGRKEFILVSRFTEKFFGDTFVSVLGYTDTTEDFSTYLDIYSPVAFFRTAKKDPRYLDSNSIITAPFDFSLRDSAALTDGGFAKITRVSLVIARKPESLNLSSVTAASLLPPAELLRLRHNSYDYVPAVPTPQIISVGWTGINPLDWPSGRYIMAIISEDEYGRTYYPNPSSESGLVNPWIVEMRTGG